MVRDTIPSRIVSIRQIILYGLYYTKTGVSRTSLYLFVNIISHSSRGYLNDVRRTLINPHWEFDLEPSVPSKEPPLP